MISDAPAPADTDATRSRCARLITTLHGGVRQESQPNLRPKDFVRQRPNGSGWNLPASRALPDPTVNRSFHVRRANSKASSRHGCCAVDSLVRLMVSIVPLLSEITR